MLQNIYGLLNDLTTVFLLFMLFKDFLKETSKMLIFIITIHSYKYVPEI